MLRKLIAAAVVAGALTVGMAGVAGAATPAPQNGHSGANAGANAIRAALCSYLPRIEGKVRSVENTVNNAWIPKLKTLETKAQQAGHTKLADRIGTRIGHIEKRESKANARLEKLSARCSASG